MPPASNGNPPYKGRSEELTTNIADFCNKIGTKPTRATSDLIPAFEVKQTSRFYDGVV